MHDLTENVAVAVARSRIKTGIVNIFNIGSTAAVGTIEFEPGLEKDLPAVLTKLLLPAAPTDTIRPGTMAMGTRISKPHCWDIP